MTKSELTEQLTALIGAPLASINQLRKALHMEDVLYRYLDGLEFVEVGKAQKYLISDVAEKIIESRKTMGQAPPIYKVKPEDLDVYQTAKNELMRQLLTAFKSPFVTITPLRQMLCVGQNALARDLAGLDFIEDGRTRRYLITDVAERIAAQSVIYRRGVS